MNQGAPTTILPCPSCRRRLRVPTGRGDLVLTCPDCRFRWDWSPMTHEEIHFIGDDRPELIDPELARALRVFETFQAQARALARSRREPPEDLWDEDIDGPRPLRGA